MGKFYSLLTSVGIYEQNLSLPSYEMDLKLMENALIEGLRLSKDTIRTLGNSGIVKMRSFVRALMEFSSMIEEEDGFILYFSGHGCNGDLCFSDGMINIQSIIDFVEKLKSKNKIIIISTHIIQDMDHLAKSLIFFKNGQLLDFKSPQELILSLKQFFYETIVSKKDLQKYIETYHVSSIVPINDDYKIKFFSHKDELFPHCKEINLEDIYLYYYGDVYDKR